MVAERLARKEQLRTDAYFPLPADIDVFCSDFRHLDLPENSVDLIFTDPPWAMRGLYGSLAEFAARVLKPGRLCCVYVSAMALPEVIAEMGKHLNYYWCLAVGYQNVRCHRNAKVSFTGTGRRCRHSAKDRLRSESRTPHSTFSRSVGIEVSGRASTSGSKSELPHTWIERMTLPGDTILDPRRGSGQFALEALNVGSRKIIANDIDPDAGHTTRCRLAEVGRPCRQ